MRFRATPILVGSLIGSVLSSSAAFAQRPTSVSIIAPSPATGTVEISASAKAGSVRRLDISADGKLLTSCFARQCATGWNTASTANGSHSVQASALLNDGRTVSATRAVLVANADVVPSTLSLGTSALSSGASTPLQLTVANRGTATAHAVAATISLVTAGGVKTPVATLTLGTLAPGASKTATATLTAPTAAGTYTVLAAAVSTDPEASTANNTTFTTVTVSSLIADVTTGSLTLGASTLTAGGSTPLQLVVSNRGTAAARSVAVTISLSAGGTPARVATINVGTLVAGAAGTFGTTLTAPTTAGTYSVIATASTPDPESSTANNTITTPLDVATSTTANRPSPVADLTASALTLGSTTLAAGSTTSLKVTVANQGTALAQSVTMKISLAAGSTISQLATISVGSLGAGASTAVATTLTAPTASGTYTVIAAAATPDAETSTTNNTTTASLGVSSTTTSPPTTACHYYASPAGTGNGSSSSSPFQLESFWAVAAPGKTLCLLDGVYQGAASMIDPGLTAPGLSGTQVSPITIRALRDGAVTIDGQFARIPVYLNGNTWWVVEGVNVKNGTTGVIALYKGANDNIFRRVVAWDASIDLNNAVVGVHSSLRNLFEDVAMFGTARKVFSGSQGGNHLTCRRCWIRWEGSTHSVGGVTTVSYNSDNYTCENCLSTYSGESMPQSYTSTFSGRVHTNYELDSAAGYQMQDGASPVGCKPVKWLGSITYVQPEDRTTLPGSGLLSTFYRFIDCVTVRDSIYAAHPSNPLFRNLLGIHASGAVDGPTVSFTNVTTLAGLANSFASGQTRLDVVASTSTSLTGDIPTIFTGSANPWIGTTGAQVCKQYRNGTLTSTPLWPWPMNDRIKAATASAGPYAGPCPTCVGGRRSRLATDVTADIEAMFGAIPAQCRRD